MIYDQQTANRTETVLQAENVNVYYGDFLAVKGIYLNIPKNKVTAFIGGLLAVVKVLCCVVIIVLTI